MNCGAGNSSGGEQLVVIDPVGRAREVLIKVVTYSLYFLTLFPPCYKWIRSSELRHED